MQRKPREVEVTAKRREEPPDSATSETRSGQQQLDWFKAAPMITCLAYMWTLKLEGEGGDQTH